MREAQPYGPIECDVGCLESDLGAISLSRASRRWSWSRSAHITAQHRWLCERVFSSITCPGESKTYVSQSNRRASSKPQMCSYGRAEKLVGVRCAVDSLSKVNQEWLPRRWNNLHRGDSERWLRVARVRGSRNRIFGTSYPAASVVRGTSLDLVLANISQLAVQLLFHLRCSDGPYLIFAMRMVRYAPLLSSSQHVTRSMLVTTETPHFLHRTD